MITIPSLEEEDAKRPGRDRQALVGERTRIINRFKSTLAWLGIRGFKPNLRNAAARLETLKTPEGTPLPGNTLAELEREITRLQLIGEQIRAIEATRRARLEQQPKAGAHPIIRRLAQIRGLGIETADMLAHEGSRTRCAISGLWRGEPVLGPRTARTRGGSPDRRTRVAAAGGKRVLPVPATPGSGAA